MLMIDRDIMEHGKELLDPFTESKVSNICYDLTTESFYNDKREDFIEYVLMPGESVFVASEETISLPDDMAAYVVLRNSRIRQGLHLDAPIYQPGHKTKVFMRITNVSSKSIHVDTENGIASILFEQLGQKVEKPYSGTFQKEEKFKGMGSYTTKLAEDLKPVDEKLEQIKHIEKNIYGNVLSIMAIFVAIFSLINVGVGFAATAAGPKMMAAFSMNIVGAMGVLIGLINMSITDKKQNTVIWIVAAVFYILSCLLLL